MVWPKAYSLETSAFEHTKAGKHCAWQYFVHMTLGSLGNPESRLGKAHLQTSFSTDGSQRLQHVDILRPIVPPEEGVHILGCC